MKTMTHYLMSFALMLALPACDSTKPVEEVTPEVRKSVGTFRGLLNGKPWTAEAEYFVTPQGFVFLRGVYRDTQRMPYEERLSISDEGSCFCAGSIRSSSGVTLSGYRFIFSENQGDGIVQMWEAVKSEGGSLRVQESDSTTKRFAATFEATFAAMMPRNVGIQTLPDTLRITEGVFEITLNTGEK